MEKNENHINILKKAISLYGICPQRWVLVEECGELLNAIAKMQRGRARKADIITELADVHIMVEQMALYYGWEDFIKEKEFKINRLKDRLEKAVQ